MANTQKVVEYLKRKLELIYDTYAGMEEGIQQDMVKLGNSGLSEKDIGQGYHRLEYITANLFRQAMLIMICSYLEEAMDLIGEGCISDYAASVKRKQGRKENWFQTRKRIYQATGVSFEEVAADCGRINDLLQIRNCVVHAGGQVDKCRSPEKLSNAVHSLQERDKEGNFNLVQIMGDGFLYFGDNVVSMAIITSEEIIDRCSEACAGCRS